MLSKHTCSLSLDRVHLFRLLYYFKTHPTARHFRILLGVRNRRNLWRWIRRATRHLAGAMAHIIPDNWTARDSGRCQRRTSTARTSCPSLTLIRCACGGQRDVPGGELCTRENTKVSL